MPSVYPKSYLGEAVRQAPKVIKANDFLHAFASIGIVANENAVVRGASRAVALRALAGIGGRLALPALGLALTAYDLYRLYQYFQAGDPLAPDLGRNVRLKDIRRESVDTFANPEAFYIPPPQLNGWFVKTDYGGSYIPSWMTPVVEDWIGNGAGWGPHYVAVDLPTLQADMAPYKGGFYELSPGDYFCWRSRTAFNPQSLPPINYWAKYATGWTVRYEKLAASPFPLPMFPGINGAAKVVPLPQPMADLIYTIDPASTPVVRPQSVPAPIPYALIPRMRTNPWRYEQYQRQAGYRVGEVPAPAGTLPLAAPMVGIATSPAVAAKAQPLTKFHYLRRPPKGTKERKIRTKGYLAVTALLNTATEAVDAVEAVYRALPRNLRPRSKQSPQAMLRLLYEHWDKVDVVQAGQNLILEELQDRVYGYFGRGLKKAAQRNWPHGELPIGYQAGPAL